MPHLHEKIDFTVEVFIVHKNTVLLRKHDKYKKWLSVGGHIEFDEDPTEAAVREVKEEVGLDVVIDDRLKEFRGELNSTDLVPPYFLNRNRISKTHEHITFIYFANSTTNKIKATLGREKSEECKWFTKDELTKSNEVIPDIKYYALQALLRLGRS